MFAEMLGIRKTPPLEEKPRVMRSVDRGASVAGEFIDELDIQKEVVEEMAREKAELEERYGLLEAERQKLETEKQTLEAEKQTLENEKRRWRRRVPPLRSRNARSRRRRSRLRRAFPRWRAISRS